jgi:hypothetical protein
MKLASIILGVIAIAFIAVQVFALKSQKNIETYPYIVEKEYKDFQIRSYEATLFSSVKLSSNNFKEASGKGFSILAGYIFGNNKTNEKIAMTSPVAMTLEDSMTMLFMVPKKFNKESLPVPNQPQIKFQNEPAKKVAAKEFKGWANDKKINKYKQMLISFLKAEEVKHTNRFYFLGYNAPYEVFNRKNEVIVELK